MSNQIEPRLQQLLDADECPSDAVDVVVRFRLPALTPSTSGSLAERRDLLARSMTSTIENSLVRAQQAAGDRPTSVSLFPSVGSAYVQASRPFVRALLALDEVQGATLNRSSTSP